MPNSAAVKAFFATRLKQPRNAAKLKSNGRVTVLVRVTDKKITFPTSYNGEGCHLLSAKRPLPGKLTVVQLSVGNTNNQIKVHHFQSNDSFAQIKNYGYPGRTVAIDFAGDVRLAGPQVFT